MNAGVSWLQALNRTEDLQKGALAVIIGATFACHRTEWVPLEGSSITNTPHATTVLNEPVPRGEVRGVVTDLRDNIPLEDALVQLDSIADQKRTPSDGSFAFRGVGSGLHTLTTRRLGFTTAVDTIRLDTDGVALRIGLGRRTVLATPPLMVERKRPWWKLW